MRGLAGVDPEAEAGRVHRVEAELSPVRRADLEYPQVGGRHLTRRALQPQHGTDVLTLMGRPRDVELRLRHSAVRVLVRGLEPGPRAVVPAGSSGRGLGVAGVLHDHVTDEDRALLLGLEF